MHLVLKELCGGRDLVLHVKNLNLALFFNERERSTQLLREMAPATLPPRQSIDDSHGRSREEGRGRSAFQEVAVGAVQERGEALRERVQAALPRREGLVQNHLEGAQREDALEEGEQAAREDGVGPLPAGPLLGVRHRALHGVPAPRGTQGIQ